MTKTDILEILEEACQSLYREDFTLIKNRTNERTIGANLYSRLKQTITNLGLDIDTEYNREGSGGKTKGDEEGNLIPDIVIHTREAVDGPNLMAIEIKGYWNSEDRNIDERKLRRLRQKYGYTYLFRLELGLYSHSFTEVDPS